MAEARRVTSRDSCRARSVPKFGGWKLPQRAIDPWSKPGIEMQLESVDGIGLLSPRFVPYRPVGVPDLVRDRSLLPKCYRVYIGGYQETKKLTLFDVVEDEGNHVSEEEAKNSASINEYRMEARRVAYEKSKGEDAQFRPGVEPTVMGMPPKALEDYSLQRLGSILGKEMKFSALQHKFNKQLYEFCDSSDTLRPFTFRRKYAALKPLHDKEAAKDINSAASMEQAEVFLKGMDQNPWYKELSKLIFSGSESQRARHSESSWMALKVPDEALESCDIVPEWLLSLYRPRLKVAVQRFIVESHKEEKIIMGAIGTACGASKFSMDCITYEFLVGEGKAGHEEGPEAAGDEESMRAQTLVCNSRAERNEVAQFYRCLFGWEVERGLNGIEDEQVTNLFNEYGRRRQSSSGNPSAQVLQVEPPLHLGEVSKVNPQKLEDRLTILEDMRDNKEFYLKYLEGEVDLSTGASLLEISVEFWERALNEQVKENIGRQILPKLKKRKGRNRKDIDFLTNNLL
ncbi:hypothetical protein SELMODRAFT_423013 [Selaginella moellendorffii]|uniref:Uncharacterized protein n=1 Tax=Selaginella moellendorffii TaxID=88036 RepID=D8SKA4_SELML|nr:hypothetical protein SELMODRAFT_423013 [Selaginella moellendorffii]